MGGRLYFLFSYYCGRTLMLLELEEKISIEDASLQGVCYTKRLPTFCGIPTLLQLFLLFQILFISIQKNSGNSLFLFSPPSICACPHYLIFMRVGVFSAKPEFFPSLFTLFSFYFVFLAFSLLFFIFFDSHESFSISVLRRVTVNLCCSCFLCVCRGERGWGVWGRVGGYSGGGYAMAGRAGGHTF